MGRNNQGRVPKAGLGKAILNSNKQQKKARRTHQKNAQQHTTDIEKLESVVERTTLDDFLSDAVLKEQSFVAEKQNFSILDLDKDQGPQVVFPHKQRRPEMFDYEEIPVPRRPRWTVDMTPDELDHLEKEAFLKWRRMLANMEENADDERKMTPFEKTLGIWKQLWRVLERSDLVCQIVDARNPKLFRSADIEQYALELNPHKKTLLIINKADYLSPIMREMWADHFEKREINFVFFSAVASQAALDEQGRLERQAEKLERESYRTKEYELPKKAPRKKREEEEEIEEGEDRPERIDEEEEEKASIGSASNSADSAASKGSAGGARRRSDIMSREELLAYFHTYMDWPNSKATLASGAYGASAQAKAAVKPRLEVGMVGYPNVGKSSTINVLAGVKRVNVGATPGKTKHFQTLNISEDTMLVDCPGLVFPTFMDSTASLVCNGILPIDQLRDYNGPVQDICQRVSREQFIKVYSLDFPHWKQLEAHELTEAHARLRGFAKNHGEWDNSRSARILLKDFVVGKLIYCHPPPELSKEQRRAFANSMALTNKHLRDVLDRAKQNNRDAGKAKENDDFDDYSTPAQSQSERKHHDDDDEDDGGIIPVNFDYDDVGDKRVHKLAVQSTIDNNINNKVLDLKVEARKQGPGKPLTKKQQRRQAKGNRDKRTKGRNMGGTNHIHAVPVHVPGQRDTAASQLF